MMILPEYDKGTITVKADAEFRCPYCEKLLFKGGLRSGSSLEIMCSRPRCRRIIKIRYE
jgi:phage FluMu protein Com